MVIERFGRGINQIANFGADATRSLIEPQPEIPASSLYIVPLLKGLEKGLEGVAKITGGRKSPSAS